MKQEVLSLLSTKWVGIRKFFIQNFVGSIEIQFGRYERFHLPNKVFTKILSSFKIVIIFNITSAKIKTKSADVLLKIITILKELFGSNFQFLLTTIKSSFSEKAPKIWKNLPLVLTLLSRNSCFVKTDGEFFSKS